MGSSLTIAAGLLSIAAESASNVVTILPARCYVGNEGILSSALAQLQAMLPDLPEGVATLGMIEMDDGVDEDYLVPCSGNSGPGLSVLGVAHRPVGRVAQHLRQHGAMVASGILTGYAGVFAAHIYNRWPVLANSLAGMNAAAVGGENRLRADMFQGVPRSALRSLKWSPPVLPQRALRVHCCGWRGLHTARAASKISESCAVTIGSVRDYQPKMDCPSFRIPQSRLVTKWP